MRPDEVSVDRLSICIDRKLSDLAPTPRECSIFKVHHRLRSTNEKAYEPEMLAIGPYHHGKDRLQVMEEHKLRYLKQLLHRREEISVEKYVRELRGLEERARKSYAESISLSINDFVQMMLLDGCFIIELFRKYKMEDATDPIIDTAWILTCLVRDLMLFENQLPFFVLCHLFTMTRVPDSVDDLISIALNFFSHPLPFLGSVEELREVPTNEIKHLLGLVHRIMLPSFPQTGNNMGEREKFEFTPCATRLKEAGVKFEKGGRYNLFVIKFKNGTLEIPCLRIEDDTETFLRNFIAYEQYCQVNNVNYITDYVTLMDCLINSSKDVELLSRSGIIDNWQGDHEVVSTMFNKLGDYVNMSEDHFCYAEIFRDVNNYHRRRRNVWMAKLRRNYLNSPWTVLSSLAAVLLLLLASAQTVFAILSYLF